MAEPVEASDGGGYCLTYKDHPLWEAFEKWKEAEHVEKLLWRCFVAGARAQSEQQENSESVYRDWC